MIIVWLVANISVTPLGSCSMTQVTVRSQSRQWWLLMAWRQAGHQKTFITVGDIACVDFIRSNRCNVGRWLLMLGVHLITRGPMGLSISYSPQHKSVVEIGFEISAHEKKIVTVSSPWPRWSRLRAQWSRLSRRRGHSSVTARSQVSHG